MKQAIDSPFLRRIQTVSEKLSGYHIDGLIIFSMSNIRYLTGFSGSDGVLLLSMNEAALLVDGRYTTQAASEAQGIAIIAYQDKPQGIEEAVAKFGLKDVGFEAAFVNVEMFNELSRRLSKARLIALSDELRLLRACKDKYEIDVMKRGAAIASASIAALAKDIRLGWTEKETALQLEMTARQAGADQIAFETIIASGENSALPHAKPGNRKFQPGDFVVIDFGVKYQGYCSDETCTFVFGELTGAQKNVYRSVLRAHDEAIASIRAGVAAADIDILVRNVLGKKYSRYFVHGTGHGVGLEVHEAPRIAPSSQDVLTAGMVVTIEPGVYYPGLWGVRIEDTVFVKKNSCEIITKMNKELIIIE